MEFLACGCLLLSKIQIEKLKSCNLVSKKISKNIAMVVDHFI